MPNILLFTVFNAIAETDLCNASRKLVRCAACRRNFLSPQGVSWMTALMSLADAVQVNGQKVCMGADVLDQQAMRMIRFMAPVTMLATGGAGQVGSHAALVTAAAIFLWDLH